MISKTIYKDLLKMQYYFIFIVLLFYEFFVGLYNPTYDLSEYVSGVFGSHWIIFTVAVGLALFQTHQIKNEQAIQFYASLPIKRNRVLYSNYFVGSTILLLGYFVRSCMIMIRNCNNGIIISRLVLFLMAGGVTMILLYTFFFFLGILHSKGGGVLVSIIFLICFCWVSISLIMEDQNQLFNIALHCYFALREWFHPVIYIDFYQNGLGMYGDSVGLYNNIYWFHTGLYSLGIIVLFVLIGKVYKKKDDANKRSLFCCSFSDWVWVLLGAFLGYTVAGTCFILIGFLINVIQSVISIYIFDYNHSNLIGFIANAGAVFGMWFSYVLLQKRKKVDK